MHVWYHTVAYIPPEPCENTTEVGFSTTQRCFVSPQKVPSTLFPFSFSSTITTIYDSFVQRFPIERYLWRFQRKFHRKFHFFHKSPPLQTKALGKKFTLAPFPPQPFCANPWRWCVYPKKAQSPYIFYISLSVQDAANQMQPCNVQLVVSLDYQRHCSASKPVSRCFWLKSLSASFWFAKASWKTHKKVHSEPPSMPWLRRVMKLHSQFCVQHFLCTNAILLQGCELLFSFSFPPIFFCTKIRRFPCSNHTWRILCIRGVFQKRF